MIYLTKKQDEFLQTFKNRYGYEPVKRDKQFPSWADNAIYNLIKFGHGWSLNNAYDTESGAFNHETKPLAVQAIFEGWKVIQEPKYYLYMDFLDEFGHYQAVYKTGGDTQSAEKGKAKLYTKSELPEFLGDWKKVVVK